MPERYAPREHPRYKEFKNKAVTREDVQVLLQYYDDERIEPLVDRLAWLELPLYKRAWYTLRAWWHEKTADDEASLTAEQLERQMAERHGTHEPEEAA